MFVHAKILKILPFPPIQYMLLFTEHSKVPMKPVCVCVWGGPPLSPIRMSIDWRQKRRPSPMLGGGPAFNSSGAHAH